MESRTEAAKYRGPFDLHEQLMEEAIALDLELLADWSEQEQLEEAKYYILGLEKALNNPLIGKRVTVTGETAIPILLDKDDNESQLGFTGEYRVAEGIYKGIYVFPFYHQDSSGYWYVRNRVVHRIEHDQDISIDTHGNTHIQIPATYLAVTGSKLETDVVTDTHSFRYLEGATNWLAGTAAETIDVIAVGDMEPADKVSAIIRYLDTNLADLIRDKELCRNVISYVNSLGIFDGIDVLSHVFLYKEGDITKARVTQQAYHISGIHGVTVKNALVMNGVDTELSNKHYELYFSVEDATYGSVLIPTSDRYAIVLNEEDD